MRVMRAAVCTQSPDETAVDPSQFWPRCTADEEMGDEKRALESYLVAA